MNSICLVLSPTTSFKWEVHQMDVKSAFLHGDLHEEIYMEQPTGFIQTNFSVVCRLKKSVYGLKKAPRAWYAKMDSFFLETNFSRCHFDNIVYTKKVGKSLIILVLYVDDLILTDSDPNLTNHVKSGLNKNFEMTDLGHLHYFLGLQVLQSKEGYVFTLGSGPITWACKKQSAISRSSTEAEYHGAIEASKEALWLRQILSKFGFQQQHLTTLWCDSQVSFNYVKIQSNISAANTLNCTCTFRKVIHDHVLEVQYCSTDDQVADIFTKALTEAKFTKLRYMLGVQEVVTKGG
eukprot:PITA_14749